MWVSLLAVCLALIMFIISVIGIVVGSGDSGYDYGHNETGHYYYADDTEPEYYYQRDRVSCPECLLFNSMRCKNAEYGVIALKT